MPSIPTDNLSENRDDRVPENVLVPDTPGRRHGNVPCGTPGGHHSNQPVADKGTRPSPDEPPSASKTAVTQNLPEGAGIITHRPCDYSLRNNEKCRQKLSGTCFNCAERKKKCRYSSAKSPTASDRADGPASMAAEETRSDVLHLRANQYAENTGLLLAGGRYHPQPNSDNPPDHITGNRGSAILASHSRTSRAPVSPTDREDSHPTTAASTAEDDLDLPHTRTIRSSNLVRRETRDAEDNQRAKRPRLARQESSDLST
ncbi:hypothetical protein CBS63078_10976 [Aspergillus niger]|nr:hypothetical protein CBS13152_11130 [Aspergillus niger]GLA79022.1 hypothetical protein AtubIFM55763_001435 [Aspergillus tubingensis]KAI2869986.1 hypothetical protein CBS11852_11149 [Aspergillus niger]KAI2886415.1 hypothetical protein CBS63078_10976 [Aspergillus niger]KAI3015725.1 hypothetical protein CBS147347_11094 [Aspergillus niger]